MISFSKREDYSILLISALAVNYKKRLIPLSEIAKEYKISVLFLRNLANNLRKKDIIGAVEGKNGGYFLNKDPKKFKIGEILTLFSKKPIIRCCSNLKDIEKCRIKDVCRPGFAWRKINKEFLDKISKLTILEFMNYKYV